MTFTPDLERAALAYANKHREIFGFEPLSDKGWQILRRSCCECFAAGLRTLIDPVSEAVVEAMCSVAIDPDGVDPGMFAAAIHAVVGKVPE